ncbi:zf-CCHC domain-containing protein [Tanacetum coccineum]
MDLCTKLSNRVLDLETTKTAQAKDIASLKKRIKKLERKRKSKTSGMKTLFKIGRYAQVVSSEDEGLGDQEDASKQGRKIADIDFDAEVTLIDETQGRNDDNLMFDTCVLDFLIVEGSAFVVVQSEKVVDEIVCRTLEEKETLVTALSSRKEEQATTNKSTKEKVQYTELVKESSKKAEEEMAQESSSKRAGEALKQEDLVISSFFGPLHPKWRAKVTAIEESKDLSSLALDELIGNLKEKGKFVRQPREKKKSFRQRDEKKGKSDRKCISCGDPNHLIGNCPKPPRNKDQKAFIGGSWSDSKNDAEDTTNNATCLMAQSSNEVTLNSSYYSDNASSLDNDSMQLEYDNLCEISLKIINKNKVLKTKRDILEKEILELNEKIKKLKRNKEIDITCKLCQELKLENSRLKETQVKFVKFDKSADRSRLY